MLNYDDFKDAFHLINRGIEMLDDLGIVSVVGERECRLFGDRFVKLVYKTAKACNAL